MFSQVLQQHRERKAALLAEIDVKEREAQAAMEAHASFALDRLNAGMATVYHNQQRIETEAGKLQQQSARFQATTQRWLRMYNEFNDSLKELGDVRDWAIAIENELDGVVKQVEAVTLLKQQKQASQNSVAKP